MRRAIEILGKSSFRETLPKDSYKMSKNRSICFVSRHFHPNVEVVKETNNTKIQFETFRRVFFLGGGGGRSNRFF